MKDVAKTGWETKPLGEVCQLINGRAYKKPELLDEGPYPVLRVGNFFTNNHWYYSDLELDEDKYCDDGDLLYAWSASFGPRIWEGGKVIYHYHIWKVLPSEHVDRDFLYYFFDWDKELIKKEQGAGATMIHVSKRSMEARAIPLPPLEEQQRIVAVLDEAFDGLDRARAHAEANLQNVRELFDAQLSAIFRKIDAGQKKPLGDVCDFVRGPFGGSLKKAIFKPSGYAVYEQQHAIRDQFEDFRYFIDDAKFAEMARFRVEAGDLIMSCSGTMGKVAIVPEGAPDGIINQALLKLRPSEELRAEFLKRWMQSDDFQDQLSANTMGVAIKNVASVKTLKTLLAVVPSLEEQDNIVGRSEEAEEQFVAITQSYEAKLKDLDDLRQSLLQKAFAGELT